MTAANLAQRCERLYTGALSDVLDQIGYPNQALPANLRPLKEGMRLAGPAFTIEGRPSEGIDYDESIRRILGMLGAVPSGHVAIYQPHTDVGAHLGELSVTSLMVRGCAGAVIDGGCRDVDYSLREGLPIFSRYTTPVDCVPRWRLEQYGEPIVIGDVAVATGDLIVADHDGILVIPASVAERVVTGAEQIVETENQVRDAVREGTPPLEAYDRFGVF